MNILCEVFEGPKEVHFISSRNCCLVLKITNSNTMTGFAHAQNLISGSAELR